MARCRCTGWVALSLCLLLLLTLLLLAVISIMSWPPPPVTTGPHRNGGVSPPSHPPGVSAIDPSATTPETSFSPTLEIAAAPSPGTSAAPTLRTSVTLNQGTSAAPTPGTSAAPIPGTSAAPTLRTSVTLNQGTSAAPTPGTSAAPTLRTSTALNKGTPTALNPGITTVTTLRTSQAPTPRTLTALAQGISTEPTLRTSTALTLRTSTAPALRTSTAFAQGISTTPTLRTSTEPSLRTSTPPILRISTEPTLRTSKEPTLRTSTAPTLRTSTALTQRTSSAHTLRTSTALAPGISTTLTLRTLTSPTLRTSTAPTLRTSTALTHRTSTAPTLRTSTVTSAAPTPRTLAEPIPGISAPLTPTTLAAPTAGTSAAPTTSTASPTRVFPSSWPEPSATSPPSSLGTSQTPWPSLPPTSLSRPPLISSSTTRSSSSRVSSQQTKGKSIPDVDQETLLTTENESENMLRKKTKFLILCSTYPSLCSSDNDMAPNEVLGVTRELLQLAIITIADVFVNASDRDASVTLELCRSSQTWDDLQNQTAQAQPFALGTDDTSKVTFRMKNLERSVASEFTEQAANYRRAKKGDRIPIVNRLIEMMAKVLQDKDGDGVEVINLSDELLKTTGGLENLPNIYVSETSVKDSKVTENTSHVAKVFGDGTEDTNVFEGSVEQSELMDRSHKNIKAVDFVEGSGYVKKNASKQEAFVTSTHQPRLVEKIMDGQKMNEESEANWDRAAESVELSKTIRESLTEADIPKGTPIMPRSETLSVEQDTSKHNTNGSTISKKLVVMPKLSTELNTADKSELHPESTKSTEEVPENQEVFHKLEPLHENAKLSEISDDVVDPKEFTEATTGSLVMRGAVEEPASYKETLKGRGAFREGGEESAIDDGTPASRESDSTASRKHIAHRVTSIATVSEAVTTSSLRQSESVTVDDLPRPQEHHEPPVREGEAEPGASRLRDYARKPVVSERALHLEGVTDGRNGSDPRGMEEKTLAINRQQNALRNTAGDYRHASSFRPAHPDVTNPFLGHRSHLRGQSLGRPIHELEVPKRGHSRLATSQDLLQHSVVDGSGASDCLDEATERNKEFLEITTNNANHKITPEVFRQSRRVEKRTKTSTLLPMHLPHRPKFRCSQWFTSVTCSPLRELPQLQDNPWAGPSLSLLLKKGTRESVEPRKQFAPTAYNRSLFPSHLPRHLTNPKTPGTTTPSRVDTPTPKSRLVVGANPESNDTTQQTTSPIRYPGLHKAYHSKIPNTDASYWPGPSHKLPLPVVPIRHRPIFSNLKPSHLIPARPFLGSTDVTPSPLHTVGAHAIPYPPHQGSTHVIPLPPHLKPGPPNQGSATGGNPTRDKPMFVKFFTRIYDTFDMMMSLAELTKNVASIEQKVTSNHTSTTLIPILTPTYALTPIQTAPTKPFSTVDCTTDLNTACTNNLNTTTRPTAPPTSTVSFTSGYSVHRTSTLTSTVVITKEVTGGVLTTYLTPKAVTRLITRTLGYMALLTSQCVVHRVCATSTLHPSAATTRSTVGSNTPGLTTQLEAGTSPVTTLTKTRVLCTNW